MKSRWEKKIKSKYKVLNRMKRIKESHYWDYATKDLKKWASTGCVCSCPMCSAKNSWYSKSERRKMRRKEQREIEEYYREMEDYNE